jgi:predicted nucleic-acid-binding protein
MKCLICISECPQNLTHPNNVRAADTNVLIRLVLQDDAVQTRAALVYVEHGVWVSTVVLAEVIWLLGSRYVMNARKLASILDDFLHHEHVTLQDADAVENALEYFSAHPKLGFSDCLIVALAQKHGHTPVGTFDKALAKIEGVQKL